jgi:multiple sugar transport system ATP-binding protein
MLYVTHDQTEAMTMATRVGVLDKGVLVQIGTPRQIYEDPVSSYVASRLGSPRINLVPRSALGETPAPPLATTAGLRAEHLGLVDGARGGLRARVQRLESLSDQRLALVTLEGTEQEIVTALPPDSVVAPGDAVQLQMRHPLWFDAHGHRVRA